MLGFVETPAGLDILQIGEDFILGRVKDEFEVEYVQVWPLERSGESQEETMLTNSRRAAAVFTGLSCFAIGCQPDDARAGGPGTFTVQDSAGIEIVESVAPAWDGDGWTVAATPSVVIGRVSGDERYLFGEVAGAVVLRDGRIAVLDGQAAVIRVYTPEGEYIEDWGGRGEGPGEFSGSLQNIFPYRGDSILVEQFAYHGSNIFDDRGRFGRGVAPEMWLVFHNDRASLFDPSLGPVRTCCTLWGPLPNGAFLGSYSEMVPYPRKRNDASLRDGGHHPRFRWNARSRGHLQGGTVQRCSTGKGPHGTAVPVPVQHGGRTGRVLRDGGRLVHDR